MTIALSPIDGVPLARSMMPLPAALAIPQNVAPTSFSQLLADGVNGVDSKLRAAESVVRSFALDDTMPVHQVTFALEQARMSFELMLQVRSRLVEGYQQIMNMQL